MTIKEVKKETMIKEAIIQQMKIHGDKPAQLARKVNESQQNFSHWLKRGDSLKIGEKCLKFYGLSIVKILNQ